MKCYTKDIYNCERFSPNLCLTMLIVHDEENDIRYYFYIYNSDFGKTNFYFFKKKRENKTEFNLNSTKVFNKREKIKAGKYDLEIPEEVKRCLFDYYIEHFIGLKIFM